MCPQRSPLPLQRFFLLPAEPALATSLSPTRVAYGRIIVPFTHLEYPVAIVNVRNGRSGIRFLLTCSAHAAKHPWLECIYRKRKSAPDAKHLSGPQVKRAETGFALLQNKRHRSDQPSQ